jgi:hypothetical protein
VLHAQPPPLRSRPFDPEPASLPPASPPGMPPSLQPSVGTAHVCVPGSQEMQGSVLEQSAFVLQQPATGIVVHVCEP